MKRTGTRFRPRLVQGDYDAIIIGSGIGGLTTAALLAKLGKRVCVLEQHYTAGGYTHSYEREGYEWDVGVHYIGEVHKPWSAIRRVFDVISDGKLQWAPMDAHYDRIVIGEQTYDYVAGREEFKAEMTRHFPGEAAVLERYVDLLSEVSAKVPRFFAGQALPRSLGMLYSKLRRLWLPDYFFKTTREVLEGLTANQELIGVLTAQWGDYGLPPAEAAFVMHAMVAKHYITGGNYPVGGATKISETIIPVIEAAGGHVFTYAGVDKILVENGRAVGVRMQKDGFEILAPQIVSCAGLVPTYTRLLDHQVASDYGLLEQLPKVKLSAATLCLYAGFKGSAAELKLPKTNYWVYPTHDHDHNVSSFMAGQNPAMPLIYISFPSAKDPAWDAHYPNKATVEIVAPTQPQWFAKWKGSTWGKRGTDYEALKAELTAQLLETLYQHQPQLRGALDFCELGTPLSTEWYQRNEQGEIYGIDHTVQRFEQHWIHSQTPIKGLYLTGADTVTAGVGGALMAGVLTASRMLGWRGYKVGKLLKSWKAETAADASATADVAASTRPPMLVACSSRVLRSNSSEARAEA